MVTNLFLPSVAAFQKRSDCNRGYTIFCVKDPWPLMPRTPGSTVAVLERPVDCTGCQTPSYCRENTPICKEELNGSTATFGGWCVHRQDFCPGGSDCCLGEKRTLPMMSCLGDCVETRSTTPRLSVNLGGVCIDGNGARYALLSVEGLLFLPVQVVVCQW
jgi:hypothetical protein